MKVIYYSRYTLIPALLAAALHCHPAINLTRALTLVADKADTPAGGLRAGIQHYAHCADGTGIFVMTFTAPPLLVENSLNSLFPLLEDSPGRLLLIPARQGGGRARSAS